MTSRKILFCIVAISFVLTGILACNAEKEATERRNLMMPKKSEMARNSRYKEIEKRKTNKVKLNKSKRKSLF
jgi:Ni/Co efflux regulator RcnB